MDFFASKLQNISTDYPKIRLLMWKNAPDVSMIFPGFSWCSTPLGVVASKHWAGLEQGGTMAIRQSTGFNRVFGS